MIDVSKLEFKMADCCGTCSAATVVIREGLEVGIIKESESRFSAVIYKNGGLFTRHLNQTSEQVSQIISEQA